MKKISILEVIGDEILLVKDSIKMTLMLDSLKPEGFPYKSLNPLQFIFYKFYIMESSRENVLVVAPTSSGKTGVALLFMGNRGVYAVPTRSLANEIYKTFVSIFGENRVGLRTGDVFEEILEDKDITVCTYESLANALRTNKVWVKAPVVIDEIHHIYKERGVVIEEVLGHLNYRKLFPILFLSATVPKPQDLAYLIGAKLLIESSYRPVPIEENTYYLKIIGRHQLEDFIVDRIVKLSEDEKSIVFVHKKDIGYKVLEKLSDKGYPIMNETLPFLPKNFGEFVAFHNADVPFEERERIEDSFRNGKLRVLIATQTLAYGVNLPADRVVIFVMEYKGKFYPDTLDVYQMKGRAGRYGLRDKGYAEIYVFSRKYSLEEAFKKLKPYLSSEEFNFDPRKYWGISSFISLMVLGAVGYAGKDWISFLLNVPSIKSISFLTLKEVYDYLERSGFIEDGKLTNIGEVLLEGSISPLGYMEMTRRLKGEIETLLTIRPLFYMKEIRGSLERFLKEDLEHLKWEFSRIYKNFYFPSDGTDEVWIYINGKLIDYPNISNPPGELGFYYTDVYHLARALFQLRENGYIFLTDEDILRIMHAYRFGLNLEFSPLGGISGIGFVRANILKRALMELGMKYVFFGNFEFPKDIVEALELHAYRRYKDLEKVKREVKVILDILEKGEVLGDEKILKGFVIIKFGKEARKYLRANKVDILSMLGIWKP